MKRHFFLNHICTYDVVGFIFFCGDDEDDEGEEADGGDVRCHVYDIHIFVVLCCVVVIYVRRKRRW